MTAPVTIDETPAFLAGGGELGARIRAMDWSRHPLGPPAGWQRSLKTAIRMALNSRYPMFVWWGPELYNFYNDAYIPVLGQRHPATLGWPAADIWTDIWHAIGPQAEAVMREGTASWSEESLLVMERNQFLEETYFTYSYSPIPDDDGGIGGVFCACTEDTHRVLGRRRLRTLRDLAERASEAKSASRACELAALTVTENPHDLPFALIYLIDADGRHAACVGHAGMDPGTPASPTTVDLTEVGASWPFHEAVESGKPIIVTDLVRRFGPLPGGAWPESPQQATVLPLAYPGSTRLAGFVVAGVSPRLVYNDEYQGFLELLARHVASAIANARAYEDERKRAEALAELDRAKTAFFSNVSHEFRTPLTLMLGPVQDLLVRDAELPASVTEQLQVVNRNGMRLLRLVNSLLDFSRIEAGRARAAYRPTDLSRFTAELASVFRAAIERGGLRLVVDCPQLSEPVFIDREMWEKVVLNLLSNALKFTFQGEIEVRLRESSAEVELLVRDTGTGIPPEETARVFERFHRIQNAQSRTYEGSGIGLALVQELIKLHGGSIRVESRVGLGTSFIITLPKGSSHLPQDQIAEGRSLESTAAGAAPFVEEALRWLPEGDAVDDEGAPLGGIGAVGLTGSDNDTRPRILIADDNADMRGYLARILASRYQVETACDGQDALALARVRLPDLVLTDVMMPRMDGFALLRELREAAETRDVPIIMLSARAGEESRVDGLHAGADDYLVKPFSVRELYARVESRLELTRMRRAAEQAERQRGAQFKTLIDQAPIGVYLIDADFRVRELNPVAKPRFDRVGGPVIGQDFGDILRRLWQSSYADEIERIFRHTLETGEPFIAREHKRVHADSDTVEYFDWRVDRIPLPEGRFGVVCYFQDISSHIEARKVIEASRELIRESEARTAFLLQLADELRPLTDAREIRAVVTAALGRHLGAGQVSYADVDETGEFAIVERDWNDGTMPSNVGKHRLAEFGLGLISDLKRGATIAIGDIRLDLRTSAPYAMATFERVSIGSFIAVPLVKAGYLVAVLTVQNRTPRQWLPREIAMAEELAERTWAAVERAQAEEALRDADRRKDEFLATLAHELRNPLAPLRNMLEVMKHAGNNDDVLGRARATMERQLDSLVRLVDDLLDVSRITRSKMELRKERVELASVIQQALETCRGLAEKLNHELIVDLPSEPIYLLADPVRLAQVFGNLIHNACKYTEPNGRVWINTERRGAEVAVNVKDTGIGIPDDQLGHIFDMFVQVDRTLERSQGGLGIGLTLVKRLVEMHGGTVTARSDGNGLGSEFTITLPVLAKTAAAPMPSAPKETSKPSPLRILIVDDNPDSTASLSMLLDMVGNETRTAEDGLDAVIAAEEFLPDVVLLDIGLPKLNGYEACRRIREQHWGKTMVLVAVTGWGQDEDRRKSREAGFDAHLVKPIDYAALTQLLASIRPTSPTS